MAPGGRGLGSLLEALGAFGSSSTELRGSRAKSGERAAPRGEGGNVVNAAQQEVVRTTFASLAVMPEVAGALFYERLFTANPRFRPLFKNDMRIQGIKL